MTNAPAPWVPPFCPNSACRFHRQDRQLWRFKKAGTDDFRVAMEAATGRDLGPFFEAWIFGVTIPRVAFSYRSLGDNNSIAVKFEQRGDVAPVPITVTLTYASGETVSAVAARLGRAAESGRQEIDR